MLLSDMTALLSICNLSTGYGKRQVLFDVSLDVWPGETLLISGGNGSGKSTLLKAIYGLLIPWNTEAKICFRLEDHRVVGTHPPTRNLMKGLGYLPQKNAVFDDLTSEDNLRLSGHILRDAQEFSARRTEVLDYLPMLGPSLGRKPETFSGGERQILALAMLMLHRPRLLLLDEPIVGLDDKNSQIILESLKAIQRKTSLTLIVVEHRQQECALLEGRGCLMTLGRLGGDLIKSEI